MAERPRAPHEIGIVVHHADGGQYSWEVVSHGREGRSRIERARTSGVAKSLKAAHTEAARSAAKEHVPA